MYTLQIYAEASGKLPFQTWLDGLNADAASRVMTRIERLRRGLFGDCKPLRDGVWELRIDFGAGYRVYYAVAGKTIVLLLYGGDKRTQTKDIERAVHYFDDFKRRT